MVTSARQHLPERTDRELVTAAREGDAEAFGLLVRRHQRRDLTGVTLDRLQGRRLAMPAPEGDHDRPVRVEEEWGQSGLGLSLWLQRSMSR